ncbi:hypothetical protein [uncultured Maribacter sp.]|uniref:hypothetical protein n=1 Tax=uncultured Maribacter sp. TaxID=431308 RepID=UPI0030D9B991
MHLFLVTGLSIFTIWVILQINSFNTSTKGEDLYLFIVPLSALLGYFGSQFVFNKKTSKINLSERLEDKLKKYQSALHLKYALIEIPAFLGLFVYFNTGNALPVVITICLLAYLFVQKPNKENIVKSLPLTSEEKTLIQNL